jgi:hypothetical protein
MEPRNESLRSRIALGWVMMLLVQTIMLVIMTVDSILMDDNFKSLRFDPGSRGLKMMVVLFALYALMPVYVYLVPGGRLPALRWIAVGLAALGFLFFLLHHLAHWHYGQRPDLSSHVLDVTIHLISLWVIVSSIRWARGRDEVAV